MQEEEEGENDDSCPAPAPLDAPRCTVDESGVAVERDAILADHATTKNGSDAERDGGTDGDRDGGSTGGDDDAVYGEVWSVPDLRRREG